MSELVAIPVYNEAELVPPLLEEIRKNYSGKILFIDDGSSDCSPCVLKKFESDSIAIIQHDKNKGYGKALRTAFDYALQNSFTSLVTMDADWQHEPKKIPDFFKKLDGIDVVSGSRYLIDDPANDPAPEDRRNINAEITELINRITGFNITDAFCGFKAYKVSSLSRLSLDEDGYAMPLQFWVQASHFNLKIREISVPRIYSDPKRQFAGPIKDPAIRLSYYHQVIEREVARWKN